MSTFEKVTHLSLIVVCGLAAYTLVDAKLSRHSRRERDNGKIVGKALDITGASWSRSPVNIVLAITTHCQYCVASVPFYRRLASESHSKNPPIPLLVAFPENRSEMEKFLTESQVQVSEMLPVSFEHIGVSGTPTLFVVDGKGSVMRQYRGKLSPSKENEVISLIEERQQ